MSEIRYLVELFKDLHLNSNSKVHTFRDDLTLVFKNWLSSNPKMTFRRTEINKMIMDYLVTEGFKEAAEKFKLEAGIEIQRLGKEAIPESIEQLDQRIEIRSAIESGKISTALWLINQYPELIDQNRHLFFKLNQQQLIELIRDKKIEEALKFAQEQLSVDEDFLELPELERTLALFAFDNPESSPYSDLLQLSHRQQLASEVNETILREQSGSNDPCKPHLVNLVKLLLWTQNELEKKKISFTKMIDLIDCRFDDN